MALEYRVLFPDSAPFLPNFLLQLPAVASMRDSLRSEGQGWVLMDGKQELIFSISATEKVDYLDFSFGPYPYRADWYVRFNTQNRFVAAEVFLELLKQLLVSEVTDFMAIFNGELIILRKENSRTYLNALSGAWEDSKALASLYPIEYTIAEYPVV